MKLKLQNGHVQYAYDYMTQCNLAQINLHKKWTLPSERSQLLLCQLCNG